MDKDKGKLSLCFFLNVFVLGLVLLFIFIFCDLLVFIFFVFLDERRFIYFGLGILFFVKL